MSNKQINKKEYNNIIVGYLIVVSNNQSKEKECFPGFYSTTS